LRTRSIDVVQLVEEPERSDQEAVTVECKPVIEVGSNRVVGYQTSIGHPRGIPNRPVRDNGHHAPNGDHTRDLLYLNLQFQKAREMGFERVFLTIESSLLRAMVMISKPLNMEVVVELTDLRALGDFQACQELIATWRAQGVKFAIDDFGVGFIALPMIARLRPDYIKVDFSGMARAVAYEELQPMTTALFPVLKSFARQALVYIP
jgi:hypothetical protein